MDNLTVYTAGLLFGFATVFIYWWNMEASHAPRNQEGKKSTGELSEEEIEEWLAVDLEKEFEKDPFTAQGDKISVLYQGQQIRIKVLYYLDRDQVLTFNRDLGLFAIGYHPKYGKFWMNFAQSSAWVISFH